MEVLGCIKNTICVLIVLVLEGVQKLRGGGFLRENIRMTQIHSVDLVIRTSKPGIFWLTLTT